ncbi:DUF2921 family protein [Deltaproteobacteria bacterium]|nr:DUF2921 family protein [Deltaproteobacteria bacterium]
MEWAWDLATQVGAALLAVAIYSYLMASKPD